MLVRGGHGLGPIIATPLLVIFFIVWWVHYEPSRWNSIKDTLSVTSFPSTSSDQQQPLPGDEYSGISPELRPHKELSSLTTSHGNYFPIIFGDKEAINPSILPHPHLVDTYIIIAQQQRSQLNNTIWFAELVCNAQFKNDTLACIESPIILPITVTDGGNCRDELLFFNFNVGPHDARAFYGPNGTYVMYGSQSAYTCFGMWMQDLRVLTDWGLEFGPTNFRKGVELRRHKPWGRVEKNWFVFWDRDEKMYVHWDIQPRRSFAKLKGDGSVGPDLAKYAKTDEQCLARYKPPTGPYMEDLHQATNSLSVTTCKRADPDCKANDSNTFVINIFHFKSYHMFHGVYEPYVMLFQQQAPFAIHAIGSKPLWINGRLKADEVKLADDYDVKTMGAWNQTEMVFVTSISWKAHGSRYHGYADDVMFIGFGVEDEKTGGIDVLASDLLEELNLCQTPATPKGIGKAG